MYQGNLSKKISFRCSSTTFNLLYSRYLKYKAYSKNCSFSDYIRNLCLATVLEDNENETVYKHDNL